MRLFSLLLFPPHKRSVIHTIPEIHILCWILSLSWWLKVAAVSSGISINSVKMWDWGSCPVILRVQAHKNENDSALGDSACRDDTFSTYLFTCPGHLRAYKQSTNMQRAKEQLSPSILQAYVYIVGLEAFPFLSSKKPLIARVSHSPTGSQTRRFSD